MWYLGLLVERDVGHLLGGVEEGVLGGLRQDVLHRACQTIHPTPTVDTHAVSIIGISRERVYQGAAKSRLVMVLLYVVRQATVATTNQQLRSGRGGKGGVPMMRAVRSAFLDEWISPKVT